MKTRYYVIILATIALSIFPVISVVFYGQVPVGINTSYFEDCEDCEQNECADGKTYDHGICMTPQTKEKSESVGDPETVLSTDTPMIHFCANIGFEKYPENLFAEFLSSPYHQDVTFLNFTSDDLKQVPEFYKLILESEQLDYPLNKRVSFEMSTEKLLELKEYMQHRTYNAFTHSGETLPNQTGAKNSDGHYRHPNILIDGNLYEINGLNFSPIVAGQTEILNVSMDGTLQELKDWFIRQNNPNNPGIYYFELNSDDDEVHLEAVLDAISQIQKSKDKIRMSEDVGDKVQNKVQDWFTEQNHMQFDGDDSKYTRYFIFNDTMYETSFVIC